MTSLLNKPNLLVPLYWDVMFQHINVEGCKHLMFILLMLLIVKYSITEESRNHNTEY